MKLLLTTILLFSINALIADGESFDIIELSNGDKKIYLKIWSTADLKNHDLKYYDYEGNYLKEVSDVVSNYLENKDSIKVYKNLVKLNVGKFLYSNSPKEERVLYLLQDEFKVDNTKLIEEFNIVDAYDGNIGGYTYTKGITNEDNIWMNDYEIEPLFHFQDYELCVMTLYGIKNNVSLKERNELKMKIDVLLKAYNYKKFHALLNSLLKKNIIMLGHCSC